MPVQVTAQGVAVHAVVQRRARVQADREHRAERRQILRQRQADVLRQECVQRRQLGRARWPGWRENRGYEPGKRARRRARGVRAGNAAGRLQQPRVKGQLVNTCKQDSTDLLNPLTSPQFRRKLYRASLFRAIYAALELNLDPFLLPLFFSFSGWKGIC